MDYNEETVLQLHDAILDLNNKVLKYNKMIIEMDRLIYNASYEEILTLRHEREVHIKSMSWNKSAKIH